MAINKPLGASQVTAVVRVANPIDRVSCDSKGYSVFFSAELRLPYYVRLAQPVPLGIQELMKIKAISDEGNIQSWSALVRCLRSRNAARIDWIQHTLDLGEADPLLRSDSLNPLECSELRDL